MLWLALSRTSACAPSLLNSWGFIRQAVTLPTLTGTGGFNAALDSALTLDRIHRKFAHLREEDAAHSSKPVAVPRRPTFTSEP